MSRASDRREGRGWPGFLFGGRVRTSTVALLIAFFATWWIFETYQPAPAPPEQVPANEIVPPGFIPDPAYTWAPRTDVQQQPPTPTTTATTPTTPTTPTSAGEEPAAPTPGTGTEPTATPEGPLPGGGVVPPPSPSEAPVPAVPPTPPLPTPGPPTTVPPIPATPAPPATP
jgi:hypothetical protein